MDQLKVAFRYIKRIHFWIICPLITLIGIAAWFMAVGALDEQREEYVSSINSAYGNVASWTAPHPNDKVAQEMSTLIEKTRNEIKEAWQNKAAQQIEVLKWPDFPWDQGTKARFLNVVEPLRPIERFVTINEETKSVEIEKDNQLNKAMREMYKEYIEDELPRLAKTAGAVWAIKGGRVLLDTEEQNNAIVDWDVDSQQKINKQHFAEKWKQSGGGAVPSTLEVLYAQEDLWVLGHLMQIIARTNEGATTRHSAAIRKILDIQIGKAAVESEVQIVSVGEQEKKEGRRREPPDPTAIVNPADGRYVDNNYEPLTADVLQQFMGNSESSIDIEQAYLAVAKRIPLRMRVSMDQRAINKLLVECSNSELTVEVRQLTIDSQEEGGKGRRGGGLGGGFEGANAFNAGGGAAKNAGSQFPFDLEVEIYGIVSIYNPVDNKALGIESEDGGPEEEEARAAAGTFR